MVHLDFTDQFGILSLAQLEYQVHQIGPCIQHIVLTNDQS